MIRLLLALFAFQAPAAEPGAGVNVERSKLRPSVVEISRRVLSYAAKKDYDRAEKAVKILEPLHKELDAVDASTSMTPLLTTLKARDLVGLQRALNELVLADTHHLFDHLTDPVKEKGLTPRTRILLAQRNMKYLQPSIPKDKRGKEVSLALEKLFRLLSDTVPHSEGYGKADKDWTTKADSLAGKILQLLDATILNPIPKQKEVKA